MSDYDSHDHEIQLEHPSVQGEGRGGAPLRDAVHDALQGYFRELNGNDGCGLYKLVLTEVEIPLLRSVMEYCGGNQTRAAHLLGLNRATLRKKLRHYGLEDAGG